MTENYSDLEIENQGNWNPVNRKGVEHVHITEAMICKRDACLKSERTRSPNKNSEPMGTSESELRTRVPAQLLVVG